jgi:hypothetical protein
MADTKMSKTLSRSSQWVNSIRDLAHNIEFEPAQHDGRGSRGVPTEIA